MIHPRTRRKNIREGMARAREEGTTLGRPRLAPTDADRIIQNWDGKNYRRLGRLLGVHWSTAWRMVKRRESESAI